MKITSVHIKNYKSLRDVNFESLENLVILIGRNSSGKSNILEALYRFFTEIDLTGQPQGLDPYLWFDGNMGKPIEITITLELDEEECSKIFPFELLRLAREKFPENTNKLTISRRMMNPPSGWQDVNLKWGGVLLIENGSPVSFNQIVTSLKIKNIQFDEMLAVFFEPEASDSNIFGNRLILLKPIKKAYFMSDYADELVKSKKVKWINIADRTREWRKYAEEEGYEVIERPLAELDLYPEIPWANPQIVNEIISAVKRELKNRFILIPAVRDTAPYNPLQRTPFIDQATQSFLIDISTSEDRTKQKFWSWIEEVFNESFQDVRISPHPKYIRVRNEDLHLPIYQRGGGEQELLLLLRYLVEGMYGSKVVYGIEEPELHTHPELARKLLNVFKQLTKNGVQIFITTHSPIFVDHTELGTTWIVKKIGKETTVIRIKESEDLRDLIFELGIRPSDIFFANALLFVEGETDRVVFPIWAEKLGMALNPPNVSIIPVHGKARGRYMLDVFIDASKAANIPYFMILDKNAENDVKKFVGKNFLIPEKNLFILKRGSIEDYYPKDTLVEAFEKVCGTSLNEDEIRKISEIPRQEELERLLERNGFRAGKKVDIGKMVAEKMRPDEIDDEIRRILERINSSLKW